MIYLDNNATTRVAPQVFDAMRPFLDASFGNPSSAHAVGREARVAIDQARENVARLLGAHPDEVVFTSCGTESDNWAILGALELTQKHHVVTTRVEHEAIRNLCKRLEANGYAVTWLDVDGDGTLDMDQLRASITAETAVVSVMLANNETGILFPVEDIAQIVKERSDALFHVDGVNATGKVPVNLDRSAIDLFSISGHKFHAPKGVGALYMRRGIALPPHQIGGGQEMGRRAGTEAVHQIVGLGAAAQLVENMEAMDHVRELRDRLENEILQLIPNSRVNGTREASRRLPNTSSISFENTNGEMILARLDELGICVSTGSACNAADHRASAVLEAMDIPYSWAMGSIRFSLSRYNTADEIGCAIEVLRKVLSQLRQISSAAA